MQKLLTSLFLIQLMSLGPAFAQSAPIVMESPMQPGRDGVLKMEGFCPSGARGRLYQTPSGHAIELYALGDNGAPRAVRQDVIEGFNKATLLLEVVLFGCNGGPAKMVLP